MNHRRRITRVEALFTCSVLGYGYAVYGVLPRPWYLPANVTAAVLFVLAARLAGADWASMGLRVDRVARGLRWGLRVALPLAATVALGVALPATRALFAAAAGTEAGLGDTLYEALVRIPIGTALAEELIFRAALLGVLLERHSPAVASGLTAAVFALWHVLQPATTAVAGGFATAVVVVVTATAGYGLAWLQLRAGSVVAPVVAHAAANTFGFVGSLAAVAATG